MTAATVRLLGDPVLRRPAAAVADVRDAAFGHHLARLHATLDAFRAEHGFGRAIAAPQIGVGVRAVASRAGPDPGEQRRSLINPEITWASTERFTLWDDCMSFPWLLVRVERHASISVRFVDEEGRPHHWEHLGPELSELLQHEIDHLDGVLALDRVAPDGHGDAVISRSAYDADPAAFRARVD